MTEFLDNTSVAEVYRFIKEFEWSPSIGHPLSDIVFSSTDDIMLDRRNMTVRLRRQQTTGLFSTDSDIWFRTWTTTPKAVRKLLMLQIFQTTPIDTLTQVRLYDGTDSLYWDGVAWSVAGTGDWNDEATINANLDTYPILPGRQFAVEVNLVTSDEYETPSVREIRVLMEVHIDYNEDLLFRSLIPFMKENLRPVANYDLPPYDQDMDEIDLNDYELDTPFNITDVVSVFDFTDDPELLTNILDSYDTGTKVITLSSTIVAGNRPFIVFRYEPKIIYTTHQDYIEVGKVPAFVLQRLEVPTSSAYNLAARETVIDKGTGNAVLVQEPWRATFEFRLHIHAPLAVDELRMMSAVMKFFDENVRIRSIGLDEYYRMQVVREFRDLITPDRADNRVMWTQFNLMDVRMPFVSKDVNGVRKVILKFSEPEPPHQDPLIGGSRVLITTHDEDSPKRWEEIVEITK